MSYINVDGISKSFKVAKRNSGLKAALKSFFKREYVTVDAVKNISFKIEKGEIVGYIGPNGAGKSTTIKMLSGILLPTAGNITVNGLNPFKDREKYVSKIGVVFGCRTVETDSGTELFNFMDLFYNIFLIGTISIAIAFFLISIKNLIMWRKYSESKKERNRKKMRYLLVFFAVFFLISVFLKISINMELKNS